MRLPTGRSEKRRTIDLTVELSSKDEMSRKESTLTVNVSSGGLRAITKRVWQPGTKLLVRFVGEDFQEQASVVYCHLLGDKRFAVGLAFSAKGQQPGD